MEKWDDSKHLRQESWIHPETGEKWCMNVLHVLAKQDSLWHYDDKMSVEVSPQYNNQKIINLAFYTTEVDPPPRFVHVQKNSVISPAGQILITLPKGGNDTRKVTVDIFFGRSIVQARAYNNSEPNNIFFTKLDHQIRKFRSTRSIYHVIFCVDRSSSMGAHSEPSPDSTSNFKATHNNRLGAAFQACHVFMRQAEQEKVNCKYSLVQFAGQSRVVFMRENFTSAQFTNQVTPITTSIGTDYASALTCITAHLVNETEENQTVIVFLSDGEDLGNQQQLNEKLSMLMKSFVDVSLHTVHIGTKGGILLKEMAAKGNGTFTPVGESLDELLRTFELLAAKL